MSTFERIILKNFHAYIEKNSLNETTQPEEKTEKKHKEPTEHKNPEVEDSEDYPEEDHEEDHEEKLDESDNGDDHDEKNDEKSSAPPDEDKFWRIIATLAWNNASDQKMSVRDIKRNLTALDIKYIKNHMDYYAEHVRDEISKQGWFVNSTPAEIKNFTWHVVGLGHMHYLSALIDPTGFIQFIWDSQPTEYQNLYDMLMSST